MDIHLWFELTYASYLVIPRLILQSMPLEWQHEFVALLNEIPETLVLDEEYESTYTVHYRKNGKFAIDPYKEYRRGRAKIKNKEVINDKVG